MCKAHLFSSGNFPPLFPHPNDDDRRPQMYLKRWMIYNDNEMTNLKFIFYLRIHKQMRGMVKGLFCAAPQPPLLSLIWYTHIIMKFVFYNRIFLLVSLLSVSNDVLLLTSIYIHHVEQQRWCEHSCIQMRPFSMKFSSLSLHLRQQIPSILLTHSHFLLLSSNFQNDICTTDDIRWENQSILTSILRQLMGEFDSLIQTFSIGVCVE